MNYLRDIRTFLNDLGGEIPSREFEEAAARWLNVRRKTLAPSSVGRNLCSLKAFAKSYRMNLRLLTEYKLPQALPVDPHPIPEGIPGVRRMIDAAGTNEHEAVIALCGFAGLRIHEALTIRASNIDTSKGRLRVMGKGAKMRSIPLSHDLMLGVASRYGHSLMNNDALFVSCGERAARRAISSIGRRAGISIPVASHDLRATFATAIWNKTHDARLIQLLLGHSSIIHTQQYIGVDNDALTSAVRL